MATTLHHIKEYSSGNDTHHSSPITYQLKSSAEQVSEHEYLIWEILLRLSAKTLVSLKPISIEWNSLISSPQFRRTHTFLHHRRRNNSSTSTTGIFLRSSAFPSTTYRFLSLCSTSPNSASLSPSFPLQIPSTGDTTKILQSCNGLLLCCSIPKPTNSQAYFLHNNRAKNPRYYYIYNPTTTEYKLLPPIRSSNTILGITLAFDPGKSLDYHCYKVVCVGYTSGAAYEYWIEVYDSYTNSWNYWHGIPFVAHCMTAFDKGAYWKNAVHWVNLKGSDCDSLYFNVEKMKLCKMPSPPSRSSIGGRGGRDNHELFVVDGSLHYLHSSGYGLGDRRVVFVMDSYESGWLPKYSFDVDGVLAKSVILCLTSLKDEGEEEDRTSLVVHKSGQILAYDIRDRRCKQILDLDRGSDRLQFGWFDAYPYTHSLAYL